MKHGLKFTGNFYTNSGQIRLDADDVTFFFDIGVRCGNFRVDVEGDYTLTGLKKGVQSWMYIGMFHVKPKSEISISSYDKIDKGIYNLPAGRWFVYVNEGNVKFMKK